MFNIKNLCLFSLGNNSKPDYEKLLALAEHAALAAATAAEPAIPPTIVADKQKLLFDWEVEGISVNTHLNTHLTVTSHLPYTQLHTNHTHSTLLTML